MNTIEHSEQLINEIQNRLEENERVAEEQIEKIQNQLEEHRDRAEEQIERINHQNEKEVESSEEEIRRLEEELEQYRKNVEEQIQRLQDEAEEYSRRIEEQVERMHEQLEQTRESAEDQTEKIREQLEHNEENTEEQIENIRNRTEEYRENAEEQIERIREQIEKFSETNQNHLERVHVETRTSVEQHNEDDTLQSLISRFDTQYNERHAGYTISQTYVVNGVEVLKYSGKLLPLSETDEHYPRHEWLQTFLDKNVAINDLNDYCNVLNARDMLMRIQQKPAVWNSGLFDIPPTDNWEVYKEAYMSRLTNPEEAPHA